MLMAGDELYNHINRTGPMAPAQVQRIFAQLVGAVSYVHSRSCVHRDLKLENILLDKQGNVKLVDFGFTREYEGKSSYLQTWCGTVCYSAPEMIKGEKYAAEKVDVWSLGIILFALLAGELPFDEDDEAITKAKILKEEPVYPADMPEGGKRLIASLMSKRPLVRPSLAEILVDPWLSEHAPQQQSILKIQQPEAFATEVEKNTLSRLRSAGVNTSNLTEHVLAQRCDALTGWWALLLEKEERKEKRRQKKRKEREAEVKSLRRISGASNWPDRLAPTITETDEEGSSPAVTGAAPRSRGRGPRRPSSSPRRPLSSNEREAMPRKGSLPHVLPEIPRVSEITSARSSVVPAMDRESIRSVSSSRQRSRAAVHDTRRHSSTLQMAAMNPDLMLPNGTLLKKRRRLRRPFLSQLASLKHWLIASAKRARSPSLKHLASQSALSAEDQSASRAGEGQAAAPGSPSPAADKKRSPGANGSSQPKLLVRTKAAPHRARLTSQASQASQASQGSYRHASVSPSPLPLTPRSSSYRRRSGLRGRTSTSSSVSSIRSLHRRRQSHSKASSTSSASVASPSGSTASRPLSGRSPQASVKVLPATPTAAAFPHDVRVVRAGSGSESRAAFAGTSAGSPGLVFARRRKSPFKGPWLTVTSGLPPPPQSVSSPPLPGQMPRMRRPRRESGSSRNGSLQGRRSGEVIAEEDEEPGELVEEVDAFSPVGDHDEVIELSHEPDVAIY